MKELLTRNHSYQSFSDIIELGRVDKRIGAGVEKSHEHGHVPDSAVET